MVVVLKWGWAWGEERDEDVADERRPGGEVDAELRLELAHDGVGGYPGPGGAGERGSLADEGLDVASELLVGHHRGSGRRRRRTLVAFF